MLKTVNFVLLWMTSSNMLPETCKTSYSTIYWQLIMQTKLLAEMRTCYDQFILQLQSILVAASLF